MQFVNIIALGLTVAHLSVMGLVKADTLGNDGATSALGAQVGGQLDSRALAQTVKTVVYTVAYGPAPAKYRTDKREIDGPTDPKYEAFITASNDYHKREVETVTKTVTVIPDYCSPLLPSVGLSTGFGNLSSSIASTVINTKPSQLVSGTLNLTATASVPAVTGATMSTVATNTTKMTGTTQVTSTDTKASSLSSTLSTASPSNVKSTSTATNTVPKATPTIASGASGAPVGTLAISSAMFLAFCAILAM